MNIHFVTDEKIAETSSKGNQEKWKDGNRWYSFPITLREIAGSSLTG